MLNKVTLIYLYGKLNLILGYLIMQNGSRSPRDGLNSTAVETLVTHIHNPPYTHTHPLPGHPHQMSLHSYLHIHAITHTYIHIHAVNIWPMLLTCKNRNNQSIIHSRTHTVTHTHTYTTSYLHTFTHLLPAPTLTLTSNL